MIWLPYSIWRVWRRARALVWLLAVAGFLGGTTISAESPLRALRIAFGVLSWVVDGPAPRRNGDAGPCNRLSPRGNPCWSTERPGAERD